jgi:hypothetical protein
MALRASGLSAVTSKNAEKIEDGKVDISSSEHKFVIGLISFLVS